MLRGREETHQGRHRQGAVRDQLSPGCPFSSQGGHFTDHFTDHLSAIELQSNALAEVTLLKDQSV